MFNRVSEKVAESMVKRGTVVSKDKELYLFGIQQGLTLILHIATTVVVGLLFGTLWQLLLFTAAYIALRSFAGGYHARTPQRCYVLSTLITIAESFIIKYVVLNVFIYIGLLFLSGIIIIVFSPIDNANKPLDDLEKKVYKKKAVIICIIEILMAVLFLCLNLLPIAACLTWTLVMVSVMMVMDIRLQKSLLKLIFNGLIK